MPASTKACEFEAEAEAEHITLSILLARHGKGVWLQVFHQADRDGAGAFGMPWYQTTNQSSPGALFNTIPSTSTVPFQENRPPYNEQAEEQDDTETESVDHISTVASKSVTTDTSKGLAGSMWNPVNMNARTDSRGSSQALFKVGSDTTKKMPIVTSGITKGPGLKASRWSE
ncbi:hypothetical protein E0Z10_g8967 [Xylaria hypoxylon]|uniref:Uncharacterized protein n=1 Tax=Xylaria hypoxylon TaxID=37992 RepID=A0A4Z0Y7K9_9PEZI|nr:hypothetical protein E0Z10_g8967 [Xylaria hypoxylon]